MVRRIELLRVEWNEEHIARHSVAPEEAEEVARNAPDLNRGRQRTYRLIGSTDGGRLLTLVVVRREGGAYYVIAARHADEDERRAYRRR